MLKCTEHKIHHFDHFEVHSSVELNHLRCHATVATVHLQDASSSQAETVSPRNNRPDVPHPGSWPHHRPSGLHDEPAPRGRKRSPAGLCRRPLGGCPPPAVTADPRHSFRAELPKATSADLRAEGGLASQTACSQAAPVTLTPLSRWWSGPRVAVRACVRDLLRRGRPRESSAPRRCCSRGSRRGPAPQFPVWSRKATAGIPPPRWRRGY